MKVIDTPRTNKIGNTVAYLSTYGQCYRAYVIPRDPKSPAQNRMRECFGISSQGWGRKLTDPQRQRWNAAAQTVPSHPSLNQYSRPSDQQPVDEPPAPVVFSPNPVGDLTVGYDEAGNVRLLLAVGTAVEDVMLSGEAPCSAGRMKHRRVCYLGLLGPAAIGQCDITAQYVVRYGQPRPGQKVFVVTCQEKNGWKAQDHVTSAIVPPARTQPTPSKTAATTSTPQAQPAASQGVSPLSRAVYKGSTPAAPGMRKGSKHEHPLSILVTSLVHGLRMAMAALGMLNRGVGARLTLNCAIA